MNATVVVRCHLHDLLVQLLLDGMGLTVPPLLEELVGLLCVLLTSQIVHRSKRPHGLLDDALQCNG